MGTDPEVILSFCHMGERNQLAQRLQPDSSSGVAPRRHSPPYEPHRPQTQVPTRTCTEFVKRVQI